jgi:hypothetical protein
VLSPITPAAEIEEVIPQRAFPPALVAKTPGPTPVCNTSTPLAPLDALFN